ncbi:MAG: hypothetical protein HC836_41840 [Richelia sp. RM2_1_2]|nr:hypothetical protein [Richelia sp. RM2_1_2]
MINQETRTLYLSQIPLIGVREVVINKGKTKDGHSLFKFSTDDPEIYIFGQVNTFGQVIYITYVNLHKNSRRRLVFDNENFLSFDLYENLKHGQDGEQISYYVYNLVDMEYGKTIHNEAYKLKIPAHSPSKGIGKQLIKEAMEVDFMFDDM